MNPASWELAKDVIAEALKRASSEREQFVRDRCGDPQLAGEIITLLKAYKDGGDFLDDPAALPEPDNFDDLEPGTRVGPYVILDSIGRGGMGVVFLGSDPRLRRKVALKCVVRSLAGSGERRLRVLHEARAAARVTHPNVATIHDVVEHDNRAFIVMEYVEGENLAARLKRERLPLSRAIAIGRQLASALAAAHAKGVVHRDLKPGNVHITSDGMVKVLDFGIANVPRVATTFASGASTVGATTQPPTRTPQPGTPPYMSPEQLRGDAVDERSDIYSLGVVLFEMATGRRPFRETEAEELADVVVKGAPRADAVDASVPEAVAETIARALAVSPDDRFQSATALATALDQVVSELDRKPLASRELIGKWTARVAAGTIMSLVGVTFLGLLTTGIFNLMLVRRGFEAEPLSSTLVWGVRSIVAPAALVVILCAAMWIASALMRIACLWQPIARVVDRVQRTPWVGRLHGVIRDPVRLANLVSVGGALALMIICWRFRELLDAWTSFVDTAPAAVLATLADGQRQLAFRFDVSLLVVGLGFCVVYILRGRARQRITDNRAGLLACLSILAIAVVLNAAPYRLIHDATGERAIFNGHRCFVIGENAGRLLLFCPALDAPRNRIVSRDDPALERRGVRDNIFTAAP